MDVFAKDSCSLPPDSGKEQLPKHTYYVLNYLQSVPLETNGVGQEDFSGIGKTDYFSRSVRIDSHRYG